MPLARRLASLLLAGTLVLGGFTALDPAPAAAASPAPGTAPGTPVTAAGLADKPPMGWNSWNRFHCDINEQLIRETADAMVASGMRDAGYEYVNIDDCWMAPTRDAGGNLQADPVRFPSGIKALADYVHAKGLKLGIYSSAGTKTCQGLPASLDHEAQDARKFAEWGVDYLKYDNCNNQGRPAIDRYRAMGEALRATGRPIVYSLCEWGSNDPWLWGRDVGGHLWRTTGDISDDWASVMSILDQQVGLEKYSGPNGWNDPDMLEVGNGGMTDTEYRAHFSLWALLNAPLIAGNDLRSMSPATKEILLNREVIAVNQDWGGIQGHKIRDDGDVEVWAKPMSDGSRAVVLLNRGSDAARVQTTTAELGLARAHSYLARDLWAHTDYETRGVVAASVPAHGAAMFLVRPSTGAHRPPLVTLDVESPRYAEPGQDLTVTTRLTDHGSHPLVAPRVTLTVPAGWTARPLGPDSGPALPPGRSLVTRWRVTVPGDTQTGTVVTLAARGSYRLSGHGRLYETSGQGTAHVVTPPGPGVNYVSDLPLLFPSNGWGPVELDRSNAERPAGDGRTLTIGGVQYAKGLGVHAPSSVTVYLGRRCSEFHAYVGLDDEVGDRGSVVFVLYGDSGELARSPVLRGADGPYAFGADVAGVTALELRVTEADDGKDYDHADWADARLTC